MNIHAISQAQMRHWTPPANSVILTDLDETTVNSDHRRSFHAENGELDIPAWKFDCTPQLIKQDTLRPWGTRFAELVNTREDCSFGICTSREFIKADYAWVSKNLKVVDKSFILCRVEGDTRDREILKHELFLNLIQSNIDVTMALNFGKLYFVDDKVKNVLAAQELGINGILIY